MKTVSFSALIPSQTLIHQNETFDSSTLDMPVKRSFKKNSIFTYIKHGFLTYTFLGRVIYKILHPLYLKIKKRK